MNDEHCIARAIELSRQGEGLVEPNPMVGCVIVREDKIIGEGWHQKFGGPHAEIHALRAAGDAARGATLYVTLEPCCHHGKTAPCSEAIIAAGITRVVTAVDDPFDEVSGGGLEQLRTAGIEVTTGVLEDEARKVLAPYLKLVTTGRPWVIAKWAMTLDGKLASRTGDSQWISCETSRRRVHELRGRVDAIVVGRRTAELDDPLLTARPPGARVATRIVLDTQASLSLDSQLVRTARQVPLLVCAGEAANEAKPGKLDDAGADVFIARGASHSERLESLLAELGRRRMTNVLFEGGTQVLASLAATGQLDEVHTFIAPKIIGGGGNAADSPLAGIDRMDDAVRLVDVEVERLDDDLYLRGRVERES